MIQQEDKRVDVVLEMRKPSLAVLWMVNGNPGKPGDPVVRPVVLEEQDVERERALNLCMEEIHVMELILKKSCAQM